jgi:hypothetical protein
MHSKLNTLYIHLNKIQPVRAREIPLQRKEACLISYSMQRLEETWFCENWHTAIFYAFLLQGFRIGKLYKNRSGIFMKYIVRRWHFYLLHSALLWWSCERWGRGDDLLHQVIGREKIYQECENLVSRANYLVRAIMVHAALVIYKRSSTFRQLIFLGSFSEELLPFTVFDFLV